MPLPAGFRGFLQHGPGFGSQSGNLWIGNALGKRRPWPHCRTGQDQACDGAGTALGVPTCAGDALAPLLLKSHGGSRESRQRGGGCGGLGRDQRDCPRLGLGGHSTTTPSIPPPAFPLARFQGEFHTESGFPAALHPRGQVSSCQASGLALLPHVPTSPRPHVPTSPCPHGPSIPAGSAAAPTASGKDTVFSCSLPPVVQPQAAPPVNTQLPTTTAPGSCHAAPPVPATSGALGGVHAPRAVGG